MTNWYIEGTHWILCEIIRQNHGGIVTVRLYNSPVLLTGRARKASNGYGALVDAVQHA
jgi:hypothetical protein